MKRVFCLFLACLLLAGVSSAQDGLDLPTELYVLTNAGAVQQYGKGMAGLTTVTPDGDFVLDFGIAPDGNWLAYRTDQGLKLRNIYTQAEDTLEEKTAGVPPVRGQGDTLAWSPKGDAIAYTTLTGLHAYFFGAGGKGTFLDIPQVQLIQISWSPDGSFLAAEADQNIWWIYRREANTLVLHSAIPSSIGVAWVGNSDLVFAPADGGLSRMSLNEANRQTLLLDNTWNYALPFRMTDGTLAVFGRQKTDTELKDGTGRLLGLAPDAPKIANLSQAPVEYGGLQWAPGGQVMITLRGGVLALVIPGSGQGITLPTADVVAYSWGPSPLGDAQGVKLPSAGYFLAKGASDIVQVWRLPADGTPAKPLTEAEADVTAYSVSPNERNLAYASGGKLWLLPLNGGKVASVADVSAEVRHVAFSPDGTRIAYDTLSTEQEPDGGIWLVPARGGTPEQLLKNGPAGQSANQPPFYREPQFAPTVNALLAISAQTELTNYQFVNLSNAKEPLDLGSYDGALWLGDGRVLAYGDGKGIGEPSPQQDVLLITPNTNQKTKLTSIPSTGRIQMAESLGKNQARLLIAANTNGPAALYVFDMRLDNGALTPAGEGGFITDPVLSPDGTWIAGQTHAGGPLTLRELKSGSQVVLADPPSINGFQWGK
jgi:Tol biopolymer transport system component